METGSLILLIVLAILFGFALGFLGCVAVINSKFVVTSKRFKGSCYRE